MALPEREVVALNPFAAIIDRLDRIEKTLASLKTDQAKPQTKYLTAKETEEALRISAPTRIRLGKKGFLVPRRIGSKLLYSQEDLDLALKSWSKWSRD